MQFLDAVKIAFKKYADFKGVASRPEYWWFTLFVFLVGLMAGSIDMAIGQDTNGPIQSILSIAIFLPQITMTVRRNRDAGFSAWWLILWVLPFVLTVYGVVSNVNALTTLTSIDPNAIDEASALQIASVLISAFGPAILAFLAVTIFFFVVSVLPTKKPKQPVVATTDY
jgi:uncharacterized membrane protein YhaH (DUF805 family)